VGELGAVQKHDAAGEALGAFASPAHQRFARHVAGEQLEDVADREHVRVDHDRPAGVAHQLGRHEAERRERLQVVDQPLSLAPAAKIALALTGAQKRMVVGVDDPDVERVGVRAVARDRVPRDQRTDHLPMVGVDEDAVFHGRALRTRGRSHAGSYQGALASRNSKARIGPIPERRPADQRSSRARRGSTRPFVAAT
jgi:hypothetical protein